MRKQIITPEDVVCLTSATKEYLCPKSANVHGIEFTRFKVRDTVSQQVLFDIAKSSEDTVEEDDDVTSGRFIRYDFPPQLLNLSSLGATIEFSVGDGEIKNFTMVERHFFHDLCLKSFHITLPFCFLNSTNTCESVSYTHLTLPTKA